MGCSGLGGRLVCHDVYVLKERRRMGIWCTKEVDEDKIVWRENCLLVNCSVKTNASSGLIAYVAVEAT